MDLFPHTTQAPQRRHGAGLWAVVFAFVAVMAFSTVPTPLYTLYQARDGFSTFMITVIFAAYAVGVTVALFFAGHVSDWLSSTAGTSARRRPSQSETCPAKNRATVTPTA